MFKETGGETPETSKNLIEEETLEGEITRYIEIELEDALDGDIEKATEASARIQEHLQERADELFNAPGRDVWLNYHMMLVFIKLAERFDEYEEDAPGQKNDFYAALDGFAGEDPDEERRNIANAWHHRMQALIKDIDYLQV